ncbi:aldo/keto reductase [Gluconacetobacter entanii]|jgi:aryl-alcohol dehydrogenase-like predicted oxidoreductase|uniref:Oxidoreductase n=1 Tax=Gluconacetobacter entanii TaxID=108528 RepID=A0A318PUC3_9PROT|nr:aldo/keto reductase [Gluconacetobacter entanii]MBE7620572.1 oxidoreductase [Komagataeibacter sp. FXV2]MCE2579181.1 aldo/keto reductase [Komagataeibacter sp. FNDCR1]MBY4640911.1 aldo/keto reductase [Gluconacetobacter entanii]MCW4580530.1 aldo/keto reductase [Gluconacetobacter entanii]MCW4583849.1 aldo/keto reductase [Gluconacetobacter entanii]
MTVSASRPGGTFRIGGELEVARLGFGAMRITGPGIWGEPADRDAALATLRLLPELGVNFVDTADAYGPFVSEDLIHEALSPYKGMVIATKGGHTRHGPDIWCPVGNPDYLQQCVLMSMRRLGVERIDLWQLHRVGPDTTPERQFEAIAAMRAQGLIRHVGLSEVTVEMIERARLYFPVATVQNRFNLVNRYSEEVLDYCTRENIGFIPWAPLAAGGLARGDNVLTRVAQARGATTGQVALAWLLRRSPVMLPIPGTSSPDHARANAQAATLSLTDAEFDALDRDGRAEWDRLRA